ncbi:MAG: SMC-Scp complex subunit ScpB [Anaerolineaceae bacterium]|nr:SMC-Scp complex subunit ScpB [Anaerolineaceae bacterium]
MSDQTCNVTVDKAQLVEAVEALLFVASGSVQTSQIAVALNAKQKEVDNAVHTLEELYADGRGLRIQWFKNRVQLTTAPKFAVFVEGFLGLEAMAKLSRAALETMAIVAYQQPITRPGIDAIRGVNSDGVLRSLLNKGMIQETGRAEGPGRPILYGVTEEFLQHFGLNSLEELPAFELEEENSEDQLLKD